MKNYLVIFLTLFCFKTYAMSEDGFIDYSVANDYNVLPDMSDRIGKSRTSEVKKGEIWHCKQERLSSTDRKLIEDYLKTLQAAWEECTENSLDCSRWNVISHSSISNKKIVVNLWEEIKKQERILYCDDNQRTHPGVISGGADL